MRRLPRIARFGAQGPGGPVVGAAGVGPSLGPQPDRCLFRKVSKRLAITILFRRATPYSILVFPTRKSSAEKRVVGYATAQPGRVWLFLYTTTHGFPFPAVGSGRDAIRECIYFFIFFQSHVRTLQQSSSFPFFRPHGRIQVRESKEKNPMSGDTCQPVRGRGQRARGVAGGSSFLAVDRSLTVGKKGQQQRQGLGQFRPG